MKQPISYQPLISKWEEYLDQSSNGSLEHFAVWLLRDRKKERISTITTDQLENYFDKNSSENNLDYKSGEAAYLIGRLNKFVRFYTKPIYREEGLNSGDEFGIIAYLDFRKECTKKEVIMENIIELTTGMDMIKRLIKQGIIKEKVNKTDKREKLISLTSKGRILLYRIYGKFANIQDVLVDLTKEERDSLVRVMKSLERFHTLNYSGILSKPQRSFEDQ